MRVAIADDSALFREGLELQLTRLGVTVAFTARTGAELLALLARHPVDAVLLARWSSGSCAGSSSCGG